MFQTVWIASAITAKVALAFSKRYWESQDVSSPAGPQIIIFQAGYIIAYNGGVDQYLDSAPAVRTLKAMVRRRSSSCRL